MYICCYSPNVISIQVILASLWELSEIHSNSSINIYIFFFFLVAEGKVEKKKSRKYYTTALLIITPKL